MRRAEAEEARGRNRELRRSGGEDGTKGGGGVRGGGVVGGEGKVPVAEGWGWVVGRVMGNQGEPGFGPTLPLP